MRNKPKTKIKCYIDEISSPIAFIFILQIRIQFHPYRSSYHRFSLISNLSNRILFFNQLEKALFAFFSFFWSKQFHKVSSQFKEFLVCSITPGSRLTRIHLVRNSTSVNFGKTPTLSNSLSANLAGRTN